ncbi:MAG: class I SAM-dependent methyltransferase [Nocardioidaceae bacterium]
MPRFATEAASVVGVEPHGDLVMWARQRTRRLDNVKVLLGSAQHLPLADDSTDVAHARWSYFFGPGCEPGLRELGRVMRRGGTAFVLDNDATASTFGRWFAGSLPMHDAEAADRFFSRVGWSVQRLLTSWKFESRADFEAVVRIEFAPDYAARILAEHTGTSVDYSVTLRFRHY